MKPFKYLWGHKKVMKDRTKELCGICSPRQDACEIIDKLECKARMLFGLMIKFNITHERKLFFDAIKDINEIRKIESNELV